MPVNPQIMKPEENARLVASYKLFRESFQPQLATIYYPSCGFDISATKAFPDSRIIYVDKDGKAIRALKKLGLEAYCADVHKFALEGSVDAVILQNQAVKIDTPVSKSRIGGFVLCNDYHSAATDLRKKGNFRLVGIVREDTGSKMLFVDKESLDDYWKPVETEEEFRNALPGFHSASYKEAGEIVKVVLGTETDILASYLRIRKAAIAKLKNSPNSGNDESNSIPNQEVEIKFKNGSFVISSLPGFISMRHGGGYYFLSPLPGKKGTVDDLFIYQREG